MPLITMKIATLPKEQKAELAQRMTQLASEITGIPTPAFLPCSSKNILRKTLP